MNRISESMHVAKRGEVRLEEPGGSSSLFDGMDNGRSASRITSVHVNGPLTSGHLRYCPCGFHSSFAGNAIEIVDRFFRQNQLCGSQIFL